MGVLYQFDQNGLIGSWSTNGLAVTEPVLCALGDGRSTLLLPNFISATVTQTGADNSKSEYPAQVDVTWRFKLDENGVPLKDENGGYLVVPPQPSFSAPDSGMYMVIAALRNGSMKVSDVAEDYIINANRALAAAGLPPIPNTNFIPLPVLTAVAKPI